MPRFAWLALLAACRAERVANEWIDVDGAHLRVVTHARPGRPALVYQPFAGAWPQIHAGDAVVLPLAARFTLVSFDPRGVGESTGAFDPYRQVDDVLEVAAYARGRWNASAVYVVGISSTGPIAILAAARGGGRVDGVLAASPTLSWRAARLPWREAIARVWGVSVETQERLPLLAQVTLMLLRTPYRRCHDTWACDGEFYNPWTYAGSALYPWPFRTYLSAGVAMYDGFGSDALGAWADVLNLTTFDVPVHLLWGEHDPPAAVNEAYARSLDTPDTRATVVPGVGHAAHLEDPDAFRAAALALARMPPLAADEPGAGVRQRAPLRYVPRKLSFGAQFACGMAILLTAVLALSLQPWVARKLVHVGIGLLLVHADLDDVRVRGSVYLATALTLALVAAGVAYRASFRPDACLRFMHAGVAIDPGVVFYVCVCSFACAVRLEFVFLLPLFLADPMGAIVGRNVRSPKLYGSKSLAGTAAVWATAFLTLPEVDAANRAAGATVIAALELWSGDYDNPAIGGFLLLRAIGHHRV